MFATESGNQISVGFLKHRIRSRCILVTRYLSFRPTSSLTNPYLPSDVWYRMKEKYASDIGIKLTGDFWYKTCKINKSASSETQPRRRSGPRLDGHGERTWQNTDQQLLILNEVTPALPDGAMELSHYSDRLAFLRSQSLTQA